MSYKTVLIFVLLISSSLYAGRLQDLLDWANGNNPYTMCKKVGHILQENRGKRSLNFTQENALEHLVAICGIRNMILQLDVHKHEVKKLDETIKETYPVLMQYLAKK